MVETRCQRAQEDRIRRPFLLLCYIIRMKQILSTVNVALRKDVDEESLAEIIRSGDLPDGSYLAVEALFTDVPVSALIEFIGRAGISRTKLREYYYQNIKTRYTNKKLEDALEPR
jgi:hypothetical protein